MLRSEAEVPLLKDESLDIENPVDESKGQNQTIQALSDHQIYEKLSAIKNTLYGEHALNRYIDGPYGCGKMEICQYAGTILGAGATLFGGGFSLAATFDPRVVITTSGWIGLGALTVAGIVSLTATMATCFSSKCRAYTMRCIDKPISFSTFVNPEELNQLLQNVGIVPVDATKILSTRDVVALGPTIDEAMSLAKKGWQFEMGKTVLSALRSVGFFTDLKPIVLGYLVSDEKMTEKLMSEDKRTYSK